MSKEEQEAIKYLKFLSNEKCECEVCQNAKKHYKIILNLIENQQKEIEELQIIADDIKGHNIVYIDTPEFENVFIRKDKIREKIKEIEKWDKELGKKEENYSITVLKELLEE